MVDVVAVGADEGQSIEDVGLVSVVDRFSLQDVAGLGGDDRLQSDGDVRGCPASAFIVECCAVTVEETGQRRGLVVDKDAGMFPRGHGVRGLRRAARAPHSPE
ncbi:hypothetical protein [Streptomyces rochei]|uniref:hypothetical protein n=1 Tax=Streptomyces rochei TaxID=1928 RepID=UPI0033BF4039